MSAFTLTPRCYIWVITVFLLTCILSGGTFLVLYMTQPETPATSWYPIIGITLVCLPWFFWVITVLYRILSRALGFRMVCWGKSVLPSNTMRNDHDCGNTEATGEGGVNLENGNTNDATNNNYSSKGDTSKQVHFGDSVAQEEHHNNNHGSYGGSISSMASHESELPLKMSMV